MDGMNLYVRFINKYDYNDRHDDDGDEERWSDNQTPWLVPLQYNLILDSQSTRRNKKQQNYNHCMIIMIISKYTHPGTGVSFL